MDNLFQNYDLSKLKLKKPRKDDNRRELIGRLAEATGRTPKSIHFSFIGMPDSWIKDAISHCLHFTNANARNAKLTEFINQSKLS